MLKSLLLVAILTSHHFGATRDFNTRNLGLGARLHAVEAGVYQNSVDRLTTYITLSRELARGPVIVGGSLGAFTGYAWPVLPVAFPYAVLRVSSHVGVQVSLLPVPHPILGVSLRLH